MVPDVHQCLINGNSVFIIIEREKFKEFLTNYVEENGSA